MHESYCSGYSWILLALFWNFYLVKNCVMYHLLRSSIPMLSFSLNTASFQCGELYYYIYGKRIIMCLMWDWAHPSPLNNVYSISVRFTLCDCMKYITVIRLLSRNLFYLNNRLLTEMKIMWRGKLQHVLIFLLICNKTSKFFFENWQNIRVSIFN